MELSATTGGSADDALTASAHRSRAFDSQLLVFEGVGMLINMLHQIPTEQSAILQVRGCQSVSPGRVRGDLPHRTSSIASWWTSAPASARALPLSTI